MDISFPQYYKDFSCIAAACPDSCCKEWCVDVDAEAAACYRTLPGKLGDRLRDVLEDTEDGTVMVIQDGRCPMWRQDGLCEIQAQLGHDALCKTCREFPRLRHDYGEFVELGLELSCPEAARLILTAPTQEWITETDAEKGTSDCDQEILDILRRSRDQLLTFLESTTLSFPQMLAVLLLFAHRVQAEIDGGEAAVLDPEAFLNTAADFDKKGDIRALTDFLAQLEILTPRWKKRLKMPLAAPQWDARHRALLRYFLYRYWLQAVSDLDIVCRAKFMVSACLLIGSLGGDLIETAQLFSKEIENDPDNLEAIFDGAYTVPALTDTNLLCLLMGGV